MSGLHRSNIHFNARLDGKDYPITGDPGADTIAIQRVVSNIFKATVKKDGRVLLNETAVISPDGRSLTIVNHYIVDTTERAEAIKRAKRAFREDHGSLRDVQITTRRCNSDGS